MRRKAKEHSCPSGQWVTRVLAALLPAGALGAYRVSGGRVEYLGPAYLSPSGSSMTVEAAKSSAPSDPVDDVYVVSGWLGEAVPSGCPPPAVGSCDGSFLTRDREFPLTTEGNNTTANYPVGPALRLQSGAYSDFAASTGSDEHGAIPSYGTYLVRPAGCSTRVTGSDACRWTMVGRLDEAPASPTPSPSPLPTASVSPLDVLTQDQLIAMATDPAAAGRLVVAEAQLAPVPVPSASQPCDPPDPCYAGQIGVNPGVVVYSGWRDSTTVGAGTYYRPEQRWLVRLEPPPVSEPQLMAFRIGRGTVEYLGDAQEVDGSFVWSVDDLAAQDSPLPDEVYAVDGWLVQSIIAECPAPNGYSSTSDMNYWCGGTFLTQQETQPPQTHGVFDLGGIHVQWGAYREFAPDPTSNSGQGTSPRHGIYLVRVVGERNTNSGQSQVWRLVGRLDPPMAAPAPNPTPSPTPSEPSEIAGQPVLSTDEAQQQIHAGYAGGLLIAGQVAFTQADCFPPADFPNTPLLAACGDGYHLLGINGSQTTIRLAIINFSGELPTGASVVVSVHTHDPLAAQCPEKYTEACQQAVVLDDVAWSQST